MSWTECERFADGSREVIAACIEVHRHLGPGLLESAYECCLAHELSLRGIAFERQVAVPLEYKGLRISPGYRIDLLIAGRLLLEVKAVVSLLPLHEAQLLTYLRATGVDTGLLVNFNVPALRRGGLRRITRSRRVDKVLPASPPSHLENTPER